MTPTRTEQRNPRTRGLDTKSTIEILRVLNQEDQRVALAVRRVLPQIARAVDAIVTSFRRRRPARVHRRGNQRAAGSAGCRGMSADVWHAAKDGAGPDSRRCKGAAWRGGGRGGFCDERRERFGQDPGYKARRGGRNRGQRNHALRPRRCRVGKKRGCVTVAVTSNPNRRWRAWHKLPSRRKPARRRLPGPHG